MVGLALVCPVTSRSKGYPFEVGLPETLQTRGAVLADQVKCLDWRAREAGFIEQAPADVVESVLARLALLIER